MTRENPGTMAPGVVSVLSEAVNVQDGSVTSRQILKRPTGNVTIFAFDKDQGLSEHTTPFDALVYIVEGAAEIQISGESHRLEAGETILMPADKPHSVQAVEKFKMLLVMIRSRK